MSDKLVYILIIIIVILIGFKIINDLKPNNKYVGKIETIITTQSNTVRITNTILPVLVVKNKNIYKINTSKNKISIQGTVIVNKVNDSLTFDLNVITLPKVIKNSIYYRDSKMYIGTEVDSVKYEQLVEYDVFKHDEVSKWNRAYVGIIGTLVVVLLLVISLR